MTREEVYRKIGIKVGHHFSYLGTECVVTDAPELLIRGTILRDWTTSQYSKMQIKGLLENIKNVYRMRIEYWHHCPYDSIEIERMIERRQKGEVGKENMS